MAPVPSLPSRKPLKSILVESAQVSDVSMSTFDASASEMTDPKQSLGAFKSKFRCAIPKFTEASPDYSFHEFVVTELTCEDEDNMTLLYKEVHPCTESHMGSASVEDFDDGVSTGSSLDDIPETDMDDNRDFDGDAIDLAEYEDMGDIPSTETASDAVKNKNTLPREGHMRQAPTITQASEAAEDLMKLLRPPWDNGKGYKNANISEFVKIRMLGMDSLLNLITHPSSTTHGKWIASSMQAAFALGKGTYCACQLRRLSKQFIEDCAILPINPFGDWNQSMLRDEDLASDINLHLQMLGKEISARKLVAFLARPDVHLKHGITKKISERTVCRYLNALGYRWRSPNKGQYADGHERDDVVWYQEHRFLPKMKALRG